MTIDETTKSRVLQKQRSYASASQKVLNLTEFEQKIGKMSKEELLKEQEKLKNKIALKYIVVDPILPKYSVQEFDIADDVEQKNRVWLRKNISFVTNILQSKLKDIGVASEEFGGFMAYVRDKFLNTTEAPHYAEAKIAGKPVSLSDKLSMTGLKAYRRFLLFLCDNLEHSCYVKNGNNSMDFTVAVADALMKEKQVDKDLARENFFTRYFLPKSIDACYKNMLKEKTVAEKLKKDFDLYEKIDETKGK